MQETKRYQIIQNATGAVIDTIEGNWDIVQIRVDELNKLGMGVYAKRIKNGGNGVKAEPLPGDTISTAQKLARGVICVDGWCSNKGGKGLGGIIITDLHGNILATHNGKKEHTPPYFEIAGIYFALKYIVNSKVNIGTIYSDSSTAVIWANGKAPSADVQERDNVMKFLSKIWALKQELDIQILKWNTKEWGEIPADARRK